MKEVWFSIQIACKNRIYGLTHWNSILPGKTLFNFKDVHQTDHRNQFMHSLQVGLKFSPFKCQNTTKINKHLL